MVKLIGAAQSKKFFGMRPGGVVTILDSLSASSAAAFSTRKLRSAYAGQCMNVRRSSDNAQQDIGFVNGVLDTASLLAFVGANNGFVTKWYDQSGNARDVSQATAVNQPQIVASGVVNLLNSKPAVKSIAANSTFLTSAAAASWINNTQFTLNDVIQTAATGSYQRVWTTSGNATADDGFNWGYTPSNYFFSQGGSASWTFGTPDTNPHIKTLQHLVTPIGGSTFYLDGTLQTTQLQPLNYINTTYTLSILGGIEMWGGNAAELIGFSSQISTTDRQTLERNQEAYYGIAGI